MKTGEARGIYSSVLKSYNEQKFKLSKQREELKERMESTPDGKTRQYIVEQLKEKDSAGSSTKQHCQTVALPQRTVHAVQRKKGKCSDD